MRKAIVDTNVILRFLVKDDDAKRKACENLLFNAKNHGITLILLPIVILEIVWVLEKVYKYKRQKIREIVEAIINTPELKVEMKEMFKNALAVYEGKNIKFADAVIGNWAVERGYNTVYTYDEKHFRKIKGLEVRSLDSENLF